MIDPFDINKELLAKQLDSSNHYILQIDKVISSLSVHTVVGQEALNKPWRYEIIFTSNDKQLSSHSVLTQKACFTFQPQLTTIFSKKISSLTQPVLPRTLYGVITEFSQLSVNKQEAQYRVVLAPRLALLGLHNYSAIYQNQSVIAVVEQILRKHGFTGIDYRLELRDSYSMREFITQWEESDLTFIQRILADIGVWFRFETDNKHGCEVLVISDSEKGYANNGSIVCKQPSGTADSGIFSIWDLQQHSKTVPQLVKVKDYNYRVANGDMLAEVNSQPDDNTTHGTQYLYGQHYKQKGDKEMIETGEWYAGIRHQQYISEQLIISGKSNQYNLSPGQRIILSGKVLETALSEGLIILSVQGKGNRVDSYVNNFTAIPFNLLKPYRPPVLPIPKISGTLPATITSPDNDTYGYLDTEGRYRVKFNFDLSVWKNGEESLWLRLAKPYSGETYGFHFPLIDGTGVAIAFTDGNPNRPYIAYAMHDSSHPDLVSITNKHRNVIRTPANNKLRMDDQRGQEHIKLATEYGKTQLNLGHSVNSQKTKRGEGFELRTDDWGVIRAGKGVYVTSYKREGNEGVKKASLDADETVSLLEAGLSVSQRLSERSDSHRAGKLEGADSFNLFVQYTASEAESRLSFTHPSMVLSSPNGIATVTPDNIYHYAEQNILLVSKNETNIAANKSIHMSAGNEYSVLAKQDIKLFSGEANVQLQSHNGDIEIVADKSLKVISNDDKIDINAKKEITIACGGAYIRIANGNIELYAPGLIKQGAQGFPFSGPKEMQPTLYSFPEQQPQKPYLKQFILVEEGTDQPIINRQYQILNKDNQVIAEGKTDAQGKTEIINTGYEEAEVRFRYKKD